MALLCLCSRSESRRYRRMKMRTLLLLCLWLSLRPCRAPPGPGLCGPCQPDRCPLHGGCRAGLVPDSCGCCLECGNLEGQACDPGNRSVFYGLCGTGLRCQAGGGGEDEEEECVCEEQEPVCGSDGRTYMNMCQLREAAFSTPELHTAGRGPCRTGRNT